MNTEETHTVRAATHHTPNLESPNHKHLSWFIVVNCILTAIVTAYSAPPEALT